MEDVRVAGSIVVATLLVAFGWYRHDTAARAPLAPELQRTAAVANTRAQVALERELAERAARELREDEARITAAVTAVVDAQTADDRAAASARFEELRREKHRLEQRIADARAAYDRANRVRCVCIDPRCVANPLAKGCM
jgi:hypothetical protein